MCYSKCFLYKHFLEESSIKSSFDSDFKKHFYHFYHLKIFIIQILKILKTFLESLLNTLQAFLQKTLQVIF